MPIKTKLLQNRLAEIAMSLEKRASALALIGLGSVGRQQHRLDAFSDLDFFVIVCPKAKTDFIQNLNWLAEVAPIAFHFQNTADGHKLLFADGVFCECAVFTPEELKNMHDPSMRVIWRRSGFEWSGTPPAPPRPTRSTEWLLGEALTNLYVGLCRDRRGEKLSGQRFIQHYAVDRVIELAEQIADPAIEGDAFSGERRFELRFPEIAPHLPDCIGGYERNQASARAILALLEAHFPINQAMKQEILALCDSSK